MAEKTLRTRFGMILTNEELTRLILKITSAGDVTVIITVNPQGQVINAQVMDAVSANDQCLRNFAVRAARLSRFSASNTAPAKQTGEILYRFIAQ